ncbi:MAG TPA: GDP-mannose 4,6-dehydratase [Polyangiaceae bacterium]|nr:GDP-mannose 4,6-dehydratase [Polyangiaceae bacterium]
MKKVLLTGSAGFIGSHAADALLARGDHVVGLDNLNSYYDPARKKANVAEVQAANHPGRYDFVEGDIRDTALLAGLFEQHAFDVVVHLAAMAGVRASMENPHLYYDVNLTGTLNLLEAARVSGLKNFVFASTSSVYGDTTLHPFTETDRCDHPLAPYSASKRAAEMLGYTFHHLYGQNFTALRFFTVYGPRGRPDMMAYKVLNNIFFGEEVPLYEGGNMKRDWTFVLDIVQGIVRAADRPLGYEVINLGRGEETLLSDFVARVEQLAGRKAKLISTPKLGADVLETRADVSKARQLLGYDPKVSVPEGVEHFWNWYRGAILKQ